jgi:hypothetical protein
MLVLRLIRQKIASLRKPDFVGDTQLADPSPVMLLTCFPGSRPDRAYLHPLRSPLLHHEFSLHINGQKLSSIR